MLDSERAGAAELGWQIEMSPMEGNRIDPVHLLLFEEVGGVYRELLPDLVVSYHWDK
jgi:hypothetical protein